LVLAISVAPQAHAQSAEQPEPCSASAYRQFDFWLGEWEVRNPNDEVVGSNFIRRILSGCVLHESWIGASGGRGQSHNIYNMQTDRWHQTWVDDSGKLLQLDGGLDDEGRMVLGGVTLGDDGASVLNEISWEPLERGQVRQVWRISQDDGSNWQVVFNGLYIPK
jgi:hypothetical protein